MSGVNTSTLLNIRQLMYTKYTWPYLGLSVHSHWVVTPHHCLVSVIIHILLFQLSLIMCSTVFPTSSLWYFSSGLCFVAPPHPPQMLVPWLTPNNKEVSRFSFLLTLVPVVLCFFPKLLVLLSFLLNHAMWQYYPPYYIVVQGLWILQFVGIS